MKYIAQIQVEFLKIARKWSDLSDEEQRGYLKRHPKSKRKLTGTISDRDESSKDKEMTSVQQKIVDICEPMIERLCDQAEREINGSVKRIEGSKSDDRNLNVRGSLYDGVSNIFGKESMETELLFRVYDVPSVWPFQNVKLSEFRINRKKRDLYVERVKQGIRENNLMKLKQAIAKYVTADFVNVSGRVRQGSKGFEFEGKLVDDKKRDWDFHARAIGAGGYNIQEYHYRYIINLSSQEVPREEVRKRVSDEARAEKERRRNVRLDERKKRDDERRVKRVVSIVRQVSSDYKNAQRLLEHDEPFLSMSDDSIREWIRTSEWGRTHVVADDDENMSKSVAGVRKFFKDRIERGRERMRELEGEYRKYFDEQGKMKYSKDELREMMRRGEIVDSKVI